MSRPWATTSMPRFTKSADVRWRRIEVGPEDGALPADAEPLSLHVGAPPELTRRLRQIGVVSRELGARLQPHLKQGQRLVSREGDLWRWDGFIAVAGGMTPAAQRLAERNRLSDMFEREKLAKRRDAAPDRLRAGSRRRITRLPPPKKSACAPSGATRRQITSPPVTPSKPSSGRHATPKRSMAVDRRSAATRAEDGATRCPGQPSTTSRTNLQASTARTIPPPRLQECAARRAGEAHRALAVAQARVATHARERETRKRRRRNHRLRAHPLGIAQRERRRSHRRS